MITCEVEPPRLDNWPESLRVDEDTIRLVGDPMPPGPGGRQMQVRFVP